MQIISTPNKFEKVLGLWQTNSGGSCGNSVVCYCLELALSLVGWQKRVNAHTSASLLRNYS